MMCNKELPAHIQEVYNNAKQPKKTRILKRTKTANKTKVPQLESIHKIYN